jgi:hypothetical protein
MRILFVALCGLAGTASSAPRWKLGFTHGPLEWISVTNSLGETNVYHYQTWKITNATGAPRKLVLDIRIVTDVNRTVIEGYYPDAEARIEAVLRKDFKNVQELRGMELADGSSVEGVSIFKDVPPVAHVLDTRVSGIIDLVSWENGKNYAEKRVWSMKYTRRGDEYERQNDVIRLKEEGWVVEGEKKEIKYR